MKCNLIFEVFQTNSTEAFLYTFMENLKVIDIYWHLHYDSFIQCFKTRLDNVLLLFNV
jgi:hypothetical protein